MIVRRETESLKYTYPNDWVNSFPWREFIPHESGLHYLDLKGNEEDGIALVTTIKENFEGFTKKQVEGAIRAHCFQAMLGHPLREDFESMVCANLRKYLSHAYQCFGENLAGLSDKIVQKKPECVVTDYA